VLLGVFFVIAEYVMLRDSSRDEPVFIVAAVPALACVLVGLIGLSTDGGWGQWGWLSHPNALFLGTAAGALIYAIYFLSIFRYRLLPLGVSEYPSVLSTLVVLLSEYLLYSHIPTPRHAVSLFVLLGLITITLISKANSGQPIRSSAALASQCS